MSEVVGSVSAPSVVRLDESVDAPRVVPSRVLALVAVAQFMVVLDATVVNGALPTIQSSLPKLADEVGVAA